MKKTKASDPIYDQLPENIKNAFSSWIGGNLTSLLKEYQNNASWFHKLDLPRGQEHLKLWRRIVLDRSALRSIFSGRLTTLKSLESWSYNESKVKGAGISFCGPDHFDVVFEKEIPLSDRLLCCDSVGIGLSHEAEIICFGHTVKLKDIISIVDSQGQKVPGDVFAAAEKYGNGTNAAELVYALRNRRT
jgi:hypothetical protein